MGAEVAMEHRNTIANSSDTLITLWVEPWGEDYTLFPQESVDVVAEECSAGFYLHWSISEGKIIIYAEGDQDAVISVYQQGKRLECGHHRGVSLTPTPHGPGTL
jgi:hypothetical protein